MKFKHFQLIILTIFLIANQNVYSKFHKKSDEKELINFSLEELMNTEVITASKLSEPVKNAPASIVVITESQIKERGYQCLDDIFEDLPGFDLVHVNGTWPTIWAGRGLYGDENKRILLMIDGIVENNILEGSVLGGQQYSLHNVKQIEIMYGPGSAMYGANAFSGIINIITKKGIEIQGVEYTQGFGSFGTHFEKILAGYEKNDFSISLSSSLYNTDGPIFKERHPNYSNSYVKDAYSINLKISYNNFTFGHFTYDRPMGDGQFSNSPAVYGYGLPSYGYNNLEGKDGGDAQADINGEKPTKWHSFTNTTYLKYNLSDKSYSFNLNSYYRVTGIDKDSYYYDFNGEDFIRYELMHNSWLYGIESNFSYKINEFNTITTGIQYEHSNVEKGYRDSEQINDFSYKALDKSYRKYTIYKNTALYLQYKHNFEKINSSFIAGIRYDKNNIYENSTNPRIGIIFNLTPVTTYKLLYGEAYRAPNNFELYTETSIRLPNPNLKSEKAHSFSLDINHLLNEDFSMNISCFYNYFNDLIVSNVNVGDLTGDGNDNTMNLNISEATIKGVEIKSEYNYLSLNIFLTLTYQIANEFQNYNELKEKSEMPNIAKFKSNFGLTYSHFLGKFFLSGNYVGNRSTSQTNPVKKINSYFLFNFNYLSNSFLNSKLNIFCRIDNILNTSWEDPGIRSATGDYYGTRHIQPGRSITAGFKYRF